MAYVRVRFGVWFKVGSGPGFGLRFSSGSSLGGLSILKVMNSDGRFKQVEGGEPPNEGSSVVEF